MEQWVFSLDVLWPLCLGGKLFEMHPVVEAHMASGLAYPSTDVTQKSSHSLRPLLLTVSGTEGGTLGDMKENAAFPDIVFAMLAMM